MRGIRSFLVLVVIAGGLGGYLYYDSKHPAEDTKKNEKVFADLKSDAITQVTVKSDKGETTTAQKQSNAWQLTQPVQAPADEAELSGITSNLASAEVQSVIDEKPSDVKQFGLDPARIQVSFKTGGTDHALLIGQKTPTGADLYARLSDKPRVFLIPSFLETTFNKSAFDLRDKTILKIDHDKTDRLEISSADRTVTLTKKGEDWQMTAPADARADFSAVDGILGRLNSTPMKAIIAENATDLKQYGLDKPDVTVHVGAGSSQAGLIVGKSAGDGIVYAKDLSRPMVFTVEKALVDELKKPADDFRIKDIFDARSFNTTAITVTYKGAPLSLEKDKDGKWKQTAPSAKAADSTRVEALLTALTNARATGFVDKDKIGGTGLDKPDPVVSIKSEDGQKQEKVSFARKGTDAYARREGDASAAKIDASQLDAITKALDALK
jgi:hypothetical protein